MNVITLSDARLSQLNAILHDRLTACVQAEELDALDALMADLRSAPDVDVLHKASIAAGATFSSFVKHLGVSSETDPFALAVKARALGDDCELDDTVVIERSYSGAFVSSWLWVSSYEAGLKDIDELLIQQVDFIKERSPDLAATNPVLSAKVEWLGLLFSNPAEVSWVNALKSDLSGDQEVSTLVFAGEKVEMPVSDIVLEVSGLSVELGFNQHTAEQVRLWEALYRTDFNRVFAVMQIDW